MTLVHPKQHFFAVEQVVVFLSQIPVVMLGIEQVLVAAVGLLSAAAFVHLVGQHHAELSLLQVVTQDLNQIVLMLAEMLMTSGFQKSALQD
jgi:hypothetical protein